MSILCINESILKCDIYTSGPCGPNPCVQWIDGLLASVSDQQTGPIDAKTHRLTDRRMEYPYKLYKQPWVKCVILCLFMTKVSITRTCNFVRAFQTYKSILCENMNKIHLLPDFIWMFTFNGAELLSYITSLQNIISTHTYASIFTIMQHEWIHECIICFLHNEIMLNLEGFMLPEDVLRLKCIHANCFLENNSIFFNWLNIDVATH